MNNLTQAQVSDVKSLDELLFDYGNTAYQEGVEGRSHDTIDGKAEKAFQAVKNRFQELEKQLAKTEECRKIACDLLKDWEAGRIISQTTKNQLAESVPKSKLREIMSIRKTTNFPRSRKTIIENIAELVQEKANNELPTKS
jgi:galactokinase/mevalonate kinase-like predicted kinase